MAGVSGADVEQLRALSKALTDGADRLQGVMTETSSRLSSTKWVGSDAQRYRSQWQSESMAHLRSTADALRSAATAVQRNADEQEQASASGGGAVGGGSGALMGLNPNGTPGDPGFANPFNQYNDFMKQTPIWPISIDTALGMTPVGDLVGKADGVAMLLDDRTTPVDKLRDGIHMIWDGSAGRMRQVGFETHDPVLYLGGVIGAQWGDVFAEASKADFSSAGIKTTVDYWNSNRDEAWGAATDAVKDYLPKMFSNFSINPF